MFGQSRPVDYIKQDLREYLNRVGKHRDERSFQEHLKKYLWNAEYTKNIDTEVFPTEDIPRGYDYRSELDIEVITPENCKNVAVELKHDFGGASELDRIERQLRDYSQVWRYIIVCSQGIDRYEDWKRIKSQFQKSGGVFRNGQEIVFISDDRNTRRSQGRREPSRQPSQDSLNPFDNVSNPFDYF
jgi:hypothetical protein